jgi:hypothetical protein
MENPISLTPTLSHRACVGGVGYQLADSKCPGYALSPSEKYPAVDIRTKKKLLIAHLPRKRSPVGVAQPPPRDCQRSK